MNEKMGIFVIGEFMGFKQEPWTRNGKSGINRVVGVKVGESTPTWGGSPEPVVQEVQIQDSDAERLAQLSPDLVGKQVFIPVFIRAIVGGRDGAFPKFIMPKGVDFGFAPNLAKALLQAPKPVGAVEPKDYKAASGA